MQSTPRTSHLSNRPGLAIHTACRNFLAVTVLTLAAAGAVHAQAYVNVTVGGAFAPGVFGQLSLGNNPPPPVLNVQPIIVGQPVYGAVPMYLHVSNEEYRDWGRHCGRYHACGHPVHFVRVEERDRWWERHNDHLRGQSYYREVEERRGDRHHERKNEYHNNDRRNEYQNQYQNDTRSESRRNFYKDPRSEAARGER